MPGLDIAPDDPTSADVVRLVQSHLDFANTHSPREDVHALDLEALSTPDISFFTIRDDGELLAMGALREIDPTHGELKSMHTAETARGRGLGRAMVDHLLDVARSRGYGRVSLETGSMEAFVPSRALYQSVGFTECTPFADYTDSPNSVCMTLEL